MLTVGVVANGPTDLLPDLSRFVHEVDIWIGADRGALSIIEQNIQLDYALGDFDSIEQNELNQIRSQAEYFKMYSQEKDETDLELALNQAFELNVGIIYLFGVTGGRLDHELINIQSLYLIEKRNVKGILIDRYNKLELTFPGEHIVRSEAYYSHISFIPLTEIVKGLTLTGFYYPLTNEQLTMGSTLCISNKLLSNKGTFFYEEGILLLVKSRDSSKKPDPLY